MNRADQAQVRTTDRRHRRARRTRHDTPCHMQTAIEITYKIRSGEPHSRRRGDGVDFLLSASENPWVSTQDVGVRGGNKGDMALQSQRATSICGYISSGEPVFTPSPIPTTATLFSRCFVVARWRTALHSSSQSHSFRSSLEMAIRKRVRESATIKGSILSIQSKIATINLG